MVEAVRFGMAITLAFDPTADESERWLACIGLDAYGAGSTPEEAIDAAATREGLGPDPLPIPDDEGDNWPDPLPFDGWPEVDDEHDDPRTLGELPVLTGKR